GARLERGRTFDERDTPEATHVAVVNQAFAERVFPGADPLGKRFGLGGVANRSDYQIVGVVENVRFRHPRLPTPPMVFLPLLQMWKEEWADNGKARSNLIGNIELLTEGRPGDLGLRVRRALADSDPNLTMLDVATFDEQLERQLGHERLMARLSEWFG